MFEKHAIRRSGFSLVELLVAVSIVVLLMALMGAAMSAARTRGNKDKTRATIAAIDSILQRHFSAMESSRVGASVPADQRGAAIRRQITADMPDSWQEVTYMRDENKLVEDANNLLPPGEPKEPLPFGSARQRSYIATLNALLALPSADITNINANASAECLFMIVMQGGLADCLSCSTLDSIPKADVDGDGAPEFLDAWGQPIRYVLWPAGYEQPLGAKYFDQTAPFDGLPATGATGGTMRPLVVSGGPSKEDSTQFGGTSYLVLGNACGDPAHATIAPLGGKDGGAADNRADNITNFLDEVER